MASKASMASPRGTASNTPENAIKDGVKTILAMKGIFNYHILQGIGSYRGVPDRVMHYKGKVIYLEIKKPSGTLSPKQIDFMEQCAADGVDYWIIKDVQDLIVKLEEA